MYIFLSRIKIKFWEKKNILCHHFNCNRQTYRAMLISADNLLDRCKFVTDRSQAACFFYDFLWSMKSRQRDLRNNCQQRFATFRVYFATGRANIRLLGLVSLLQDFAAVPKVLESSQDTWRHFKIFLVNLILYNSSINDSSYYSLYIWRCIISWMNFEYIYITFRYKYMWEMII